MSAIAVTAAPSSRRRAAFTLIELLVVIAIIAILAAILFPVFAQAREKARSIACINNEKQISMGLLQYEQDADETLPYTFFGASGEYSYDNGAGTIRYKWMDAIYPYVKNEAVFNCPDEDFPFKNGTSSRTFQPYGYYLTHPSNGTYSNYGSYAMNAVYRYDKFVQPPSGGNSGTGYQRGLAIADIRAPSQCIWVADAYPIPNLSQGGIYQFGWSCLKSGSGAGCTSYQPTTLKGAGGIINTSYNPPQIDNLVARHVSGSLTNVIYCDGHAKPVSLDAIAQPTTSGGTQITSGAFAGYIGAFIVQGY